MEEFVSKHFRLLLGKMYRANPKDDYLWIAFESENTKFQEIIDMIKFDCKEVILAQGLE